MVAIKHKFLLFVSIFFAIIILLFNNITQFLQTFNTNIINLLVLMIAVIIAMLYIFVIRND